MSRVQRLGDRGPTRRPARGPNRRGCAARRCGTGCRPGSRPKMATRCWLSEMLAISSGVSGGLSASRQWSRKMSSRRIDVRVDADREERVDVDQAHFDVFDPALAQRVQRPLAGMDALLGPDRAVELVLDLQQAGGELVVVVAVADADRLVRRVGLRERGIERRGVALQAVVAHRERSLGVALVAERSHAQRRAPGHVQRALGERLQLGARGRRRRCCTPRARRPAGTAAARNVAGNCGSGRSRRRSGSPRPCLRARPRAAARATRPRAAKSCNECPRWSACAGRSGGRGRCGRRSWRARRWSCRSGRSGSARPRAACRACCCTRAFRRRSAR